MKHKAEHRDEVLHMRIIAAYGEGLFLEMLNELFAERDILRQALITIRDKSEDLTSCECAADALIDSRK